MLVVGACSGAVTETFAEISSGLDDGGGVTDARTAQTSSMAAAEEPMESSPTEEPDSAQTGDGGLTSIVLQTSNFGRDIVFTADMTIAVADVTAASSEVTRIVSSAGGFLFGAIFGTLCVNLGATTGATLAFLTARYLLRDTVE